MIYDPIFLNINADEGSNSEKSQISMYCMISKKKFFNFFYKKKKKKKKA